MGPRSTAVASLSASHLGAAPASLTLTQVRTHPGPNSNPATITLTRVE